jgi:hypothetical protein
MVDKTLSPQARSGLIARAARQALGEAQAQNRQALGRVPEHETFVDRRKGAALESVDPDRGVIVFAFEVVTVASEMMAEIGRLLVVNSPVLSGDYQRSHRLYADGVEVERFDPAAQAQEWVFSTPIPYARKIERGLSDQAPDGVFEAVAAHVARRYGNIAAIKFTFRDVDGAGRQPAIAVRIR